jgi:surface protein
MSKQNSIKNLLGLSKKKAPPGGDKEEEEEEEEEEQEEEEEEEEEQQNTARTSKPTLDAKQLWHRRGNKTRNRTGASGEGEREFSKRRSGGTGLETEEVEREEKRKEEGGLHVTKRMRNGAFPVEGPGQMDDIMVEEESEQGLTAPDEVPLATLEDSTPHIPAAMLVDEDRELERDEVLRQRDEFARRFQGISEAQSVHALPAGNEEDVATEATGSYSRNKYIMIAGCISMILVVTIVVATVLLTSSSPADTSFTERPAVAPTSPPLTYTPTGRPTVEPTMLPTFQPTLPPGTKCFETTLELYEAVDLFIVGSDATMSLLESAYGLPIGAWCVSRIQDFSSVFSIYRSFNATTFNSDISTWEVSSATNMDNMFYEASSFNKDLAAWDVSKVSSMQQMFYDATSFDQDLSSWNTSRVENMSEMLSYLGPTQLPSIKMSRHGIRQEWRI